MVGYADTRALYDFVFARPSFVSPRDVTRISFPTATIKSASFKTITWRRPDGEGESCCGSSRVKSGSELVESSRCWGCVASAGEEKIG